MCFLPPFFFFISFTFAILLGGCGIGLGCLGATGHTCYGATSITGATTTPNSDGTVTVTIGGTGFVSGATVTVNGTNCSSVHVISSTQLTCLLPSGNIPLVGIVVTNPGGGGGGGGLTSPIVSVIAATALDAGGSDPWSGVNNALTSDGAYATSFDLTQGSNYIYLKGFFPLATYPLPSSATIDGVVVNCYLASFITGLGVVWAQHFFLLKNGTPVGTDHGASGAGYFLSQNSFGLSSNFGSSSDPWAPSLTAADITNAGFGIAIRPVINAGAFATAKIDYCQMSVYWH